MSVEVSSAATEPIRLLLADSDGPMAGAAVTLSIFRRTVGGAVEVLDWDAEMFVDPAAATASTITMDAEDATYRPGVYVREFDLTFPSNAQVTDIYSGTIFLDGSPIETVEIRSGTVNTINTIAAFGAPPSAATISTQVNADITTAHGAGSYQTASTAGLATGTNVTDARDAVLAKLPAALVGGRIDASVGAMAADVLTSSALAGSAVTEIQAGLATAAALATAQGNITTILGYGAPPSAAANAASVWSTTEGSGTMGASLALLRRRATNKRHMSGSGVISFYADDGTTVEKTVTITDKDGVAISVASGDPARSSAET